MVLNVRRLAWLLCSLPFFWLLLGAFTVNLGANPVETLEHETGSWALNFLLASLAVTPLRTLTGRHELAPLRRTLGLFGFSYAVLHFSIYLFLDRSLLWSEILKDLTKRPYVMLGMATLLTLLVLACTSPKRMVRRLGAQRWKVIHRLAYLAAPLAVGHYLWLKWDKNLLEDPMIYAAVLASLLGYRIVARLRRSASRSALDSA
ncbi:protein-methionine-sulfoxide reductase heme-binding subunit MsrQ [Limnobacter sp.]|uniref:sulfite oxidase heme-binding subunit YedZ n=1 Tax=Limnobacter sp. TaxID=2003368 RepID=UPI00258A62A8|nr:protein-methionine-sulfoxide reductase heme-binding subunit MsrQ [Limnobacter sp.]